MGYYSGLLKGSLQVAGCRLQVTGCRLQLRGYRLHGTVDRLQVAGGCGARAGITAAFQMVDMTPMLKGSCMCGRLTLYPEGLTEQNSAQGCRGVCV